MQFQQLKDPDTGNVDPNRMQMTDDDGWISTFVKGHRYWDAYEDWLAAGNKPLPAA